MRSRKTKWVILCCREKHRRADSGGQVENTKEIERIVVKELGKMPP